MENLAMKKIKKIAVMTSGGDAPGMNAFIRTVVRYGLGKDLEVYGIEEGYKGLIKNQFKYMDFDSVCFATDRRWGAKVQDFRQMLQLQISRPKKQYISKQIYEKFLKLTYMEDTTNRDLLRLVSRLVHNDFLSIHRRKILERQRSDLNQNQMFLVLLPKIC